jgi:hypothetical protein
MSKIWRQAFGASREDADRDERYARLMAALSFVELGTLMSLPGEVQPDGALLALAQAELLKMDKYKAPRDKLLCLVNVKTMVENIVAAAARAGANIGGAPPPHPGSRHRCPVLLPCCAALRLHRRSTASAGKRAGVPWSSLALALANWTAPPPPLAMCLPPTSTDTSTPPTCHLVLQAPTPSSLCCCLWSCVRAPRGWPATWSTSSGTAPPRACRGSLTTCCATWRVPASGAAPPSSRLSGAAVLPARGGAAQQRRQCWGSLESVAAH